MRETGIGFTLALSAVALAAGWAAWELRDPTLGAGAGVVAIYVLHLVRVRRLRSTCEKARVLERLSAELDGTRSTEPVVTRRFGPAAVALIEGAMEPAQVVRAMIAGRRPGGPGFSQYVLDQGYLTGRELKQLMQTRKEGRFLAVQVRAAHRKVKEVMGG